MILASFKEVYIDGKWYAAHVPYWATEEYIEIQRKFCYEVLIDGIDYADTVFSYLTEGRGVRSRF